MANCGAGDVRLTMGGEPTFVSIDDMDGAGMEYRPRSSPKKLELSLDLLRRLKHRFAPGSLLHFGQGKWYPGEPLPRWALACYWRPDGEPVWSDERLIAFDAPAKPLDRAASKAFARRLANQLGVHADYAMPAYESVIRTIK